VRSASDRAVDAAIPRFDRQFFYQVQRNLTQACSERASGIASLPLERIERAVQPDGTQRSALKLHVLPIVGPVVVDLAGHLPSGRIHANGRGFVPYIRRDLYAKLVAAAGSPSQGDHASTQAAAASGSTKPPSPNGHGDPPKNWDEIAPGHVVIALDEPGEGWYETIVVETSGDMLTLRWRDYPRERRITRHRLSVGLLYPHGLPATDPNSRSPKLQSGKPKSLAKSTSAELAAAFPKTWDDIDINCLVLAKEDGPWRTWWEAIPTDKSDHMFLLRWRDFPQVPAITRPRWTLGLLYPNGR
jgi:hypothetical protein